MGLEFPYFLSHSLKWEERFKLIPGLKDLEENKVDSFKDPKN